MSPSPEPMSLKKEPEMKNAWALMQPDNYNLKTDVKTLHYRVH